MTHNLRAEVGRKCGSSTDNPLKTLEAEVGRKCGSSILKSLKSFGGTVRKLTPPPKGGEGARRAPRPIEWGQAT